jgi:drug/metabolite transporter (DMT)-like permease
VRDCNTTKPKFFEQPVLQTAQMFVGESGCWLVVLLSTIYTKLAVRRKGYTPITDSTNTGSTTNDDGIDDDDGENPLARPLIAKDADGRIKLKGKAVLLLALPSVCDITGTTLMNVGLLFVAASIYQMTRGALVLFVGLFSVIFLKRRLYAYHWFSLVVVVTGVAVVGLAGAIQKHPQAKPVNPAGGSKLVEEVGGYLVRRAKDIKDHPEALQTVLGVLMIAGAQIFTASQFVLEEWILEKYSIEPIKMVGWEGVFGFVITIVGMIILHFAIGVTDAGRYGYFDAKEGWHQMTTHPRIGFTSFLIMLSIGGFNFFGLSVTRTVSATARSTIDTCRTLFIWLVSLGLGWETFKWLQIAGFALLVYGTFVFNEIVAAPWARCVGRKVTSLSRSD